MCDQTIEETINKDTQTAGGTKGFSLKSGAVKKYYLNAEHRSLFLRQLREMVGSGGSRLNHPDLQQSRILKDEADVQSLVNLMKDSWINPFRSDQDSLVSLATAAMPPMEIAHDLMNASMVSMWSPQFRLSCMLLPRYFAVLTFCRLCQCCWYDGTIFFFFRVALNV